jgi:hypothetical protein
MKRDDVLDDGPVYDREHGCTCVECRKVENFCPCEVCRPRGRVRTAVREWTYPLVVPLVVVDPLTPWARLPHALAVRVGVS